jgi:signal transduction histidine kinase
MRYEIRSVPLSEVVEEVEAVIAPLAQARDIALSMMKECRGVDLRIRTDAEKLAQILVNLLSNAVKFTRPGGCVDLECEERDERIHIRVRDDGVGIAPADQERVFEPFVQLDSGLTRNEQGTGLGLAISRDFARGMDGDLTVESTPGRGSTFTLILPRGDVPAAGAPQA